MGSEMCIRDRFIVSAIHFQVINLKHIRYNIVSGVVILSMSIINNGFVQNIGAALSFIPSEKVLARIFLKQHIAGT